MRMKKRRARSRQRAASASAHTVVAHHDPAPENFPPIIELPSWTAFSKVIDQRRPRPPPSRQQSRLLIAALASNANANANANANSNTNTGAQPQPDTFSPLLLNAWDINLCWSSAAAERAIEIVSSKAEKVLAREARWFSGGARPPSSSSSNQRRRQREQFARGRTMCEQVKGDAEVEKKQPSGDSDYEFSEFSPRSPIRDEAAAALALLQRPSSASASSSASSWESVGGGGRPPPLLPSKQSPRRKCKEPKVPTSPIEARVPQPPRSGPGPGPGPGPGSSFSVRTSSAARSRRVVGGGGDGKENQAPPSAEEEPSLILAGLVDSNDDDGDGDGHGDVDAVVSNGQESQRRITLADLNKPIEDRLGMRGYKSSF